MFDIKKQLHFFNNVVNVSLPEKFTFPFQYVPHKLTELAVKELQSYLESQEDFNGGFDKLGKMFGVLVVQTSGGSLAYLAGFSGKIDEKVCIDGFVPPIFDTLNPQGFFKLGEQELNIINQKIIAFKQNKDYQNLISQQKDLLKEADQKIQNFKQQIKQAKKLRDNKRKSIVNLPEDQQLEFEKQLNNESIRLNYLLKDLKREYQNKIASFNQELINFEQPLRTLKQLRKQKSASLQQKLHQSYQLLNYKGEVQNLLNIFEDYPPAGAGECALPKLLQFAYKNKCKPLAMAEFWWGKSGASQIRNHKHYYPSCKSKCKPILSFMLQGLHVDENPVKNRENITLSILYEDDFLLVLNKPHGFLSSEGKEIKDSVYYRMKSYLPQATGPLLVHRLDMATSGLLVVAKRSDIHKNLQEQFTNRTVKKRYVAILDGSIDQSKGVINLPLRVDYHNRPRQLVCYNSGKPAFTRFEVLEQSANTTKVYLYPETGRTHQLRVHCASSLGLNTPILGDVLYGRANSRLFLHAERLEFTHPITQKRLVFNCKAEF